MPGHLGHIVGCAGTEAFVKALASELGPRNIRVLCVRSHAIADAVLNSDIALAWRRLDRSPAVLHLVATLNEIQPATR